MADGTDVTLEDLARLCDVFYIGGTKVGALFGEAVVIPQPNLIPHFFTLIKQHGAAGQGPSAGPQFDTLFTDGLYFRIARHAIEMAQRLKTVFRDKGYRFYLETGTNQQVYRCWSAASWRPSPPRSPSASGRTWTTSTPSSASPPAGPPDRRILTPWRPAVTVSNYSVILRLSAKCYIIRYKEYEPQEVNRYVQEI